MMCSTEYVELKRIDELLQCGICYEYMDTSMITLCSHNYCSLCIRRYLHYKTQCPTCSEETFEKDLRKNKLLDEIINQYLNFKEKFVKKYQEKILAVEHKNFEIVHSPSNSEYKMKQNIPDTNKILHKNLNSLELMSSNTTPQKYKDYQQDVSSPSTSTEHRIPSIFTPKSRKGFRNEENCQIVTCPVCKVDLPQNNINKHLDDCLKRENKKDLPKKSEPRRKPLPKLVLSLMKDNVIRKRLKELGLSSQGDRKMLENRLQRYTILYNAECDKINPRPVSELIKQCEEEENLEKKIQKPSNRLNINRNTEQNIIEQQRKKYLTVNKDSFDQLIAKIKPANSPQKLPVKRNILSRENSDIQYIDYIAENNSTITDNEKKFLPLNSANYIEDSDSDTSCVLQTYSSTNLMNFLSVELNSSSNDSIDQCTFNRDTSNHPRKSSSISYNSSVKTKNVKTEELSPENSLMYEEIASNGRSIQCNALEDVMGIERLVSKPVKNELETRKKAKLSTKKNDANDSLETCVIHSKSLDNQQQESCNNNTDSIVEDVEHFIAESDNIQDDREKPKHEQLYDMKEYTSDGTKLEKENVQSLDENIKTYVLRKREHEVAFVSNDEEKIENRGTNTRKSLRLGLSEVAKKSVRLRNKISNDMKKVTS